MSSNLASVLLAGCSNTSEFAIPGDIHAIHATERLESNSAVYPPLKTERSVTQKSSTQIKAELNRSKERKSKIFCAVVRARLSTRRRTSGTRGTSYGKGGWRLSLKGNQ